MNRIAKVLKSNKSERYTNEYLVLLYRFALMMLFFTVFRVIFFVFNTSSFPDVTLGSFIRILQGGLMFDLSALLYLNGLYSILCILPFPFRFSNVYQRIVKWIYMLFNGLGIGLNSIDIIYFRFINKRTTYNVFDILSNEDNMLALWGQFFIDFWYIALIFILAIISLSYLYSYFKPKPFRFSIKWIQYPVSLVVLVLFAALSIIGIRGGYRHSTRPINMSNAGKFVESPSEMALVLNTPFCIIRTWNKKSFQEVHYFSTEEQLEAVYNPVYTPSDSAVVSRKNVVVFILESFNGEYLGALNKDLDEGNYKGYTPFIDSLMQHSFVIENSFANGHKSIDAMPSVLASVPSLVLPYTVSEYSSNKVNGMAELLAKKGYETAFFHGAPNGSMGFDAFAKISGFQKYFGRDEYNNDDDFDGIWGIWDEPFFQFYADEMNQMQEPFFTSLFSISSHHPFKVPEKYEGVFPKGPLPVHECIGYTDNALRTFFAKAKTMPWYNNTLFVITADHSSASHFKSSHNSRNTFSIPLFFYSPGDSLVKKWDSGIAQQIDIMPTVLNYLEYDEPYLAFGNDLFDEDAARFTMNYTNGYYQFAQGDLLVYFDGKEIRSVFDVKDDPSLKNDIKESIDYKNIERNCKAFVQQYNNRMIEDRLTP
ncbi:LTA synthase family protein [Carboxylicivirga sp. N1Y90]|uniref:LTA synthase family protein n=1 Tax=Carboxylicivirga fragile TaxID=3417571 RepID=UPI003D346920|nr:sulfatase-like hydrolase/transferase [Marinilabiliaceae bacterium N1Y90]